MLTMKNKLVAAGLSIGLLAGVSTARANTIVQSFNIPTQAPGVDNFTYNLFNTNIGNLTSVTLELVLNATADVEIFNSSGSPQTFTNAFTSFPITVTGPPGPITFITTSVSANIASGTTDSALEDQFPGTAGHTDSGIIPVSNTFWPGNYETAGVGTSAFPLTFTAGSASSGVTGPANGSLGAGGNGSVGDANSFLYLVYNYDPPAAPGMPEPGAWALLVASGAVSVAGLRRRRASK